MTLTRRMVADAIDECNDKIADQQEMKKAIFQHNRSVLMAARGQTKLQAAAETAALKVAIRQRQNIRKNPEAAKAQFELFDEILTEITAEPPRARAHAREDGDRAPSAAEIADLVAEEIAAKKTAAKLAAEEATPEDRKKAHIKAAADRAEAASRARAAQPR